MWPCATTATSSLQVFLHAMGGENFVRQHLVSFRKSFASSPARGTRGRVRIPPAEACSGYPARTDSRRVGTLPRPLLKSGYGGCHGNDCFVRQVHQRT